jgi:hypothetical protein
VIPRSQLDAITRRVTELRQRFDAVRQLAGPRGNVFALLGRIFSAGPWLSREEFSAIAASSRGRDRESRGIRVTGS